MRVLQNFNIELEIRYIPVFLTMPMDLLQLLFSEPLPDLIFPSPLIWSGEVKQEKEAKVPITNKEPLFPEVYLYQSCIISYQQPKY